MQVEMRRDDVDVWDRALFLKRAVSSTDNRPKV